MTSTITAIVIIKTKKPTAILIGKPITKIFICGTVLPVIPSAIVTKNNVATIGADI